MRNKSVPRLLHGIIKRHPDGFGFFIPEDVEHPDVFIPAQAMKTAMTNDKVSITAEQERDGRFRGEIMNITDRSQKKIAGAFSVWNERYGLIKDEGKGWGKDLKIPLDKSLKAKKGELVVARITEYPDKGEFMGEVVEIIGDIQDALNDIKRVVVAQNIPEEFAPQTLEEAKIHAANPSEKDFVGRKDIRHINIITIDGATAKDFDDAVHVEMNGHGFHLIVAIADVSHYVKPGTSMDKDAYERGTSVYFPNFVIPMLPEALSNGLCSLNPHVPRLALVADMHFDFTGVMTESSFYEGVIESKARVTYGQAQEIIDKPDGDSETHKKFAHVQENIMRCADLAKILMAKRFKDGSLDLEVPETELVIDGSGEPVDVIKSERLFAHRLIEEMMLAANVAVAKEFAKKDIPAIFRTHEPPDPLKIAILEKFMATFGGQVHLSGDRLQKKLTKALHEFKNEVQAQVIHMLTLRSMSQARYTLENIGHFGLGFDFYTHFTSPIRRYPDLIVHRLLKNIIGIGGYRLMAEEDVQTAGTWLSACEQRSAKAERQIQAIKKARFMKRLVGQEFDGMISSVTKFGVFVLLREYNIDGLIRLDDLGGDNWQFDEENLRLVAKRSGASYNLGDRVRVTVNSTDIESGQVNFLLEGATESKATGKKNNSKYARGKDDFKKSGHRGGRNEKRSEKGSGRSEKGSDRFAKIDKKFPSFQKEKPATRNAEDSRPARSLKMQAIQKNEARFKVPTPDHVEKPRASGPQEIKPKYASLSDYLDQMAKKGKSNNGNQSSDKKSGQSKDKSGHKFSSNRQDSQKRDTTSNDSGGVRKARPKKSGRKAKSR